MGYVVVMASQAMLTLAEAGRPEEVLVLWRQLVCVQGLGGVDIKPETYVLTLRSATKLRAWEEVETILGMMEVRRRCDQSDTRLLERSLG